MFKQVINIAKLVAENGPTAFDTAKTILKAAVPVVAGLGIWSFLNKGYNMTASAISNRSHADKSQLMGFFKTAASAAVGVILGILAVVGVLMITDKLPQSEKSDETDAEDEDSGTDEQEHRKESVKQP